MPKLYNGSVGITGRQALFLLLDKKTWHKFLFFEQPANSTHSYSTPR